MKTLMWLLAFVLMASLVVAVPPSPFPVLVQVEMGGVVVSGQAVNVELLDSELGSVIDRLSFTTDGSGRVLFDLNDFKGCTDYATDGVCYARYSRSYAGDDLKFSTSYVGVSYSVVKNVEELALKVGVDPKSQWVKLANPSAPVQVIEKEKEVVVPLVVTKERIICEDGTEVENKDECVVGWSVTEKLMVSLVGLVVVGLGALYAYNKQKYKWAKGMGGILKSKLELAERLKREGKIDAARKALETARKTATTLRNGYIKKKDDKK